MRLVLNIVWLIFAGFWLAISYALAGILMFILIITIPFGFASFRLAAYALWPLGRTIVRKPTAGAGSAVGNVLWFLLAGVWIAIGHLITSVTLAVSIIGIPLVWPNIKLAVVALMPLGKEIVSRDDPRAVGGLI